MSKVPDSGALHILESALERVAARNLARYDGVMGMLPDWVFDPLKREFEATCGDLLDHYSHNDILGFMRARTQELTPGFGWSKHYPPEITDKLDALLYIKTIVRLGEHDGLNAYLGKGGARVYRGVVNKEIAKKDRVDALQRLILGIMASNPRMKRPELVEALRNHEHGEIIETILDDEGTIEWHDKNHRVKETRISGRAMVSAIMGLPGVLHPAHQVLQRRG